MKKTKSANVLRKYYPLVIVFAAITLFSACSKKDEDNKEEYNSITKYKVPKYIFFFIGDGMGMPQINLTEAALNNPDFKLKDASVGLGSMNIRKFPVTGMQTTHAEDRYITGSAASATALATGHKTVVNNISMAGDDKTPIKTMAEMAKEKGMKVGIISSVSIDHATPACFYAHESHRGHYNNIAAQMATSGFHYFGGGFAKGDYQKYRDRDPEKDPKDIIAEMKKAGFTITRNKAELQAVKPGTKCWAYTEVDGSGALPYEIDRKKDHLSLADFTQKGIELLENEKGFFLMVEGGKIDWACHANDAVTAAHDMIAFDMAIGKAIEFYNAHKDETLIVVTGDHECGGLALGFASTKYETSFGVLKNQKISCDELTDKVYAWKKDADMTFEMAMAEVKASFGLGNEAVGLKLSDYQKQLLKQAYDNSMDKDFNRKTDENVIKYGGYDPFTVTVSHVLNQIAGIDWTSYSHTGVPVPVMAMGQGQYEFNGYYDNTDIGKKIMSIAKLENKE